LTAPPPKSFLTLPKKLVTNSPHVTQTQQSLPAGEAPQIPEARSNTDFNNSFRSNSSSVASELYNLTDISLGPNPLEPQQPQKQKSISPKPETKNFFTSSLPTPNNASQLFAATSQQPQEEAFEALLNQQATNHSIDHLINKSNSTSTSSINQSLNSSLSSSQNNQIFNNNNNNNTNQTLLPSQGFFADKIAPVSNTNIKNSLNTSDANISNYFQNEPLQQQPTQQASKLGDFNFSPANQNIDTSQQHQQTTHHIPQQPTYAQPIFQQQQTQQRNPIPNHPIPFQSYRPQSQAPPQPQFNNSIPSSTNPSPFSAQPQQPINQQQSVNPSPMFFNPALGLTGTQELLTGIQPPPTGSFQQPPPTGSFQQPPPTGSFQQQPLTGIQPPPTGSFQQKPPTGIQPPPTGSFQQKPPTGIQPPPTGSFQQLPPTGSFQQPPPTGSFQQQPLTGIQPPPTGSFQQQPPTGIQPPPTGSFQQTQFYNNNGNSIIKDNSLNLIKGPPTASEIGQRVQQSAQLNLSSQMKTGIYCNRCFFKLFSSFSSSRIFYIVSPIFYR